MSIKDQEQCGGEMIRTQRKSPENGNFLDLKKLFTCCFFKITKYLANSQKRLENIMSIREIIVKAIKEVGSEQ